MSGRISEQHQHGVCPEPVQGEGKGEGEGGEGEGEGADGEGEGGEGEGDALFLAETRTSQLSDVSPVGFFHSESHGASLAHDLARMCVCVCVCVCVCARVCVRVSMICTDTDKCIVYVHMHMVHALGRSGARR